MSKYEPTDPFECFLEEMEYALIGHDKPNVPRHIIESWMAHSEWRKCVADNRARATEPVDGGET